MRLSTVEQHDKVVNHVSHGCISRSVNHIFAVGSRRCRVNEVPGNLLKGHSVAVSYRDFVGWISLEWIGQSPLLFPLVTSAMVCSDAKWCPEFSMEMVGSWLLWTHLCHSLLRADILLIRGWVMLESTGGHEKGIDFMDLTVLMWALLNPTRLHYSATEYTRARADVLITAAPVCLFVSNIISAFYFACIFLRVIFIGHGSIKYYS